MSALNQAIDEKRSGRRGLGPFTGRQLTTIIVATILAVGLPAGAFAAITGSSVFITDHTTGAHASVTGAGNLQTTALPPGGAVEAVGQASNTNRDCGFYRVPKGKDLIITDIQFLSVGATGDGPGDNVAYIDTDKKASCGDLSYTLTGGVWASDAPDEVQFNPGLTIKAGIYLDMRGDNPQDYTSTAFVYGYLVNATSCTGACNTNPENVASHSELRFPR